MRENPAHLTAKMWVKGRASYRLAFRELGLSIGLHALERPHRLVESSPTVFDKRQLLQKQIESLMRYLPWIEIIESFRLEPANREAASYTEHLDINNVMQATSLIPDGYLTV